MKKSILLGIAITSAFVIGVLSANPVADAMAGWKFALDEHQSDDSAHHESSSGTELYTKTQSFAVMGSRTETVTQNCDPGDTVINGYLVDSGVVIDGNQFASRANDSNGWLIEFITTLNPGDPFDFVIVCAEGTLPEN